MKTTPEIPSKTLRPSPEGAGVIPIAHGLPLLWAPILQISRLRRAVALSFAFLAAASFACAEPIGYERWTPNYGYDSNVFINQSFATVYAKWASPLVLFGPALPQKDKRLIDIEVNIDPVTGKELVSGVWIENKGFFRRESWLLHGVTQPDVELISTLDGLIIVDIERYKRGKQILFAMIIQRNPNNLKWELNLGVLGGPYAKDGYRILDFEYLYPAYYDLPEDQANSAYWDVIQIENPPGTADFIESEFALLSFNELAEAQEDWTLHITDFEGVTSYGMWAVIVHDYAHSFRFFSNQGGVGVSPGTIVGNNDLYGPVRDVEGSDTHPYGWQSMNLLED